MRPPRKKSAQNDGRAAKVHHNGPRGDHDWRFGPRGIASSSEAHVPSHNSLKRWFVKERTSEDKKGMLRTFIDTTNVGDSGPPLVDEDWHACQVIYKGVEEAEWENLYYMYVEMHKAIKLKEQASKESKALWSVDAKANGESYR